MSGHTFAFIDLAGFTALTEAHGDEEAVDLLERFVDLAEGAVVDRGRFVKSIGDAVMLTFPAPEPALDATGDLFAACSEQVGFPAFRAGLHHGDAVERGGDWFGATVNLAARVAAQAHGGQVLATDVVARAAVAAGVPVVDLGSFELRHITQPVELFEVRVCPGVAGGAVDPVCHMRVERDSAAGRLRHDDTDYWFCSLACAQGFAAAPDRYVRKEAGTR